MPFSDVLKIIPKLDNKDLAAMERSLSARFTKVAKKFGSGIMSALKGGGLVGLITGFIDKVLNPLKEVQEAIDRTLKTADDVATNAQQFNTSSGKLLKAVTLAKATGLDQDGLFMLMSKFQTAVAQAKVNPNDPSVSSVKNYVNQKDMVEAFFGFMGELKQLSTDQQVLVQQQVFGEKQILKMSEFLNADFAKVGKATGIDKISSDRATRAVEKNAGLSDLNDSLTAGRDFRDLIKKSGVITESMIRQRDAQEKQLLDKENQRIASYESLAQISMTAEKIYGVIEKGIVMLGDLIKIVTPFVNKVTNAIDKMLSSPMVRGFKGWFGGKDGE